MYKISLRVNRVNVLLINLRSIKDDVKKKYTKTVLLPRTNFPARLSGRKRVDTDNYLLEKSGLSELYNWQRENLDGPDFILHDGPPYANGKPHMGHAINKILKDIVLRDKVIRGQRVHYVPGWDCHGLPIEIKAIKDAKNLHPLELRSRARTFAENAIMIQKKAFESWGILADWNQSACYFTNQISYMKNQLCQFLKLYEKGLVFRAFKPVYWSPSSRTALAESELEYNEDHKSKSIILRLQVSNLPSKLSGRFDNQKVYALIWTTTPWTLVANQAVAFSPDFLYCFVKDKEGNVNIIAKDCMQNVECKIGSLRTLEIFQGSDLTGTVYLHPITEELLPFLPGKHVTTNLGTGLVHTAPAHGPDDFLIALQNDMPVLSVVNEEGEYAEAAGKEFFGLEVLGNGTEAVLNRVHKNVLHTEMYTHSYPYDWRTKSPVIIRASHQWFIDVNSIKKKAVDSIADIRMYPMHNHSALKNALLTNISQRTYWCISRQRVWGTPIPVLYHKVTGKTYTSSKWIKELCNLIEQHGADCWWKLSLDKLVGTEVLEEFNVKTDDVEKGMDIMDIWFDSGISWSTVLPEGKADLNLEGIDQFRGWFQTSLLTSIALQECSPYKALFVHGFAVDKEGCKMSKSVGNVINPDKITKGDENSVKDPVYGVDTLRWWVAHHGCQHSQVPVTSELIRDSYEDINRIRLTLRFLLGALYPYSVRSRVKPRYLYLDKYILHRLYEYNKEIQSLYDNYQFNSVCRAVKHFVANDISSVYCHLIKDRLYCDETTSPSRAAAVEVIGNILTILTRSIAPIVPYLAEEVWLHHPENQASMVSVYRTKVTTPESWNEPIVVNYVSAALDVKKKLNSCIETADSKELTVTINAPKHKYLLLSALHRETYSSKSELCDILQVSSVTLVENEALAETNIDVIKIKEALCKRCRRYIETHPDGLCNRCIEVLKSTDITMHSVLT